MEAAGLLVVNRAGATARPRCGQALARSWLVATTLVLTGLLVACGGKAVIDGSATGEGGSGGTTTTSTNAGGQGAGPLTITVTNVNVSVGCKPGYEPPDPVQVSFLAIYENGSSANATASITEAKITFGAAPDTLVWSFQVSPSTVGPVLANSSAQVDHQKADGSGSGGGVPCDFCGSSTAPLLEVDYLVDGQYAVAATGSGVVGCLK